MTDRIDLGPLQLTRRQQCATLTLSDPDEVTLEIPAEYDQALHATIDQMLAEGVSVEMDLEGLPGISSRQLALMLTLRKLVLEQQPRLPLRGVTPGVQRVLELTRTCQFFEVL
jgi:anti-anti-sigma regulatory factor